MKSIKCKNTKPEMSVRCELHKRGYRYRANDHRLPGRPDIVLPKYNSILFIHGCYWHAHTCDLFKVPKSNRDFWLRKFSENVKRDSENIIKLQSLGWRVGIIWECALRESSRNYEAKKIIYDIECWLKGDRQAIEITKDGITHEIYKYTADNLEVLAI